MSREDPQLRVRIPDFIKSTIEARAKKNKRTLTAEISERLMTTIEQDNMVGDSPDGHSHLLNEYNLLLARLEKVRVKYRRQFQAEWAYDHKFELIEAMRKVEEILNRDAESDQDDE
jgi:hypothetical protein